MISGRIVDLMMGAMSVILCKVLRSKVRDQGHKNTA